MLSRNYCHGAPGWRSRWDAGTQRPSRGALCSPGGPDAHHRIHFPANPGAAVGALPGISGSLRHPVFPRAIPVRTAVPALIAKRRHTTGSVKALGQRCPAHGGVCGEGRENTGPMTQTDDALRLPRVEACPPTLQIWCLSATDTNLSRSSLRDTVNFLKQAQKSQPPQRFRVTGGSPILRASEKGGGQVRKKTTDDLPDNTHFPQSPELLDQDISRWKQRGQEEGGRKPGAGQPFASSPPRLPEKWRELGGG